MSARSPGASRPRSSSPTVSAVSRVWLATTSARRAAAAAAVPPPVREQRRREAAVADRADVGAAVAEAGHRVRVGEHLADRVEVAVDVVEDRDVEQRPPLVLEEQVVGHLDRRPPLALGAREGRAPDELAYDLMLADGGKRLLYSPIFNYAEGSLDGAAGDAAARVLGAGPGRRRRPRRHDLRRQLPDDAADALVPRPHARREARRRVRRAQPSAATRPKRSASPTAACWRPGMKADVNVIDFDNLQPASPRDALRPARRRQAPAAAGRRLPAHVRRRRGDVHQRRAHRRAARPSWCGAHAA